MNATDPTFANILQTQGNLEHYHVPKYQREYTWGKNEWEQLITDIDENDQGYFMGSIICIDDNAELGPGESRIYQVVDGQQRLTTLTLLLMALYKRFTDLKKEIAEELEDDDEELENFQLALSSLRKQLVHKKGKINKGENQAIKEKGKEKNKYVFLRVQPSTQGSNYDDYVHVLNELGLIKGNFSIKYCGIRRIYKAYRYFYEQIPADFQGLQRLLEKINSLKFIHISVASSAYAFTLFESLNNRGVPLSVMDIIKNKILATLDKKDIMEIDDAYEEWQDLLKFLPEYKDQERFLRHYYNALKIYPEIKVDRVNKATKSTLIKVYETLIKRNPKELFEDLLSKAELYNLFLEPENTDLSKQREALIDLQHIGAAPSYLLLIYLYSLEEEKIVNREETLEKVLDFLVKYYVRRNITDFPNTRDLDAINIETIELCDAHLKKDGVLNAEFIINSILSNRGKPATIETFKDHLEDNLYDYNSWMARYVLIKLDEMSHSREYKPDLWSRNEKGLWVWTVEHVFPQGNKIPKSWVEMVGDGDYDTAKEIQNEWVHCLGNLTLSGYNSKLSNDSFPNKQGLRENKRILGHQINIGYRNGLSLNNLQFSDENTSLANISTWTKETIESRNKVMVDLLLKMYAFEGENVSEVSE